MLHMNLRYYPFIAALVFCLLCLGVTVLSSSMVDPMSVDAHHYLGFSPVRTIPYPLYIRWVESVFGTFDNAIAIQTIAYLLSLFYLLFYLFSNYRTIFAILVSCVLVFNVLNHSYHTAYLTESPSLMFHNIILVFLLKYIKNKTLLIVSLLALFVGFSGTIRPALLSNYAALVAVIVIINWSVKKRMVIHLSVAIALMASVFATERIVYNHYHKEPNSLLGLTLYGKTAMMMFFDSYEDPEFTGPDKARHQMLYDATKKQMAFFKEESEYQNMFVYGRAFRNYEVYFQYYAIEDMIESGLLPIDFEYSNDEKSDYGKQIIFQNIPSFIQLAITHYLSHCLVLTHTFFSHLTDMGLANFSEAKYEITHIDYSQGAVKKMLSLVIFPGAIFLAIMTLFIGLRSLYLVLKDQLLKRNSLPPIVYAITVLMVFSQFNFLFISGANIILPRYMMLMYPFFSLAIIAYFFYLFKWPIEKEQQAL